MLMLCCVRRNNHPWLLTIQQNVVPLSRHWQWSIYCWSHWVDVCRVLRAPVICHRWYQARHGQPTLLTLCVNQSWHAICIDYDKPLHKSLFCECKWHHHHVMPSKANKHTTACSPEHLFAQPGLVKVFTMPIDGFHMSADKWRFRDLSRFTTLSRNAVAALQTADQTAFWGNYYTQMPKRWPCRNGACCLPALP